MEKFKLVWKIKASTDSYKILYKTSLHSFTHTHVHTQMLSLITRSLHKLQNLEKIFKKFKITKNLNASIDFGQIQYQSSSINVSCLFAFLWR